MNDLTPLICEVLRYQVVDSRGLHGLLHWGRVYDNGLRLAAETEANVEVVRLFAFLHDSRRFNDGTDPEHGERGAEFAKLLRGRFFELEDEEFELLYVACRDHEKGRTDGDVTVRTCWDADRLDLSRAGITPDPNRLCTRPAMSRGMRQWAAERANSDAVSEVVADLWDEIVSDAG